MFQERVQQCAGEASVCAHTWGGARGLADPRVGGSGMEDVCTGKGGQGEFGGAVGLPLDIRVQRGARGT